MASGPLQSLSSHIAAGQLSSQILSHEVYVTVSLVQNRRPVRLCEVFDTFVTAGYASRTSSFGIKLCLKSIALIYGYNYCSNDLAVYEYSQTSLVLPHLFSSTNEGCNTNEKVRVRI
jgi:hypothetical protein